MAYNSFIERLEACVDNSLSEMYAVVDCTFPRESQIQNILVASFQALSPQEQANIVETLGTEWYLDVATKIEKRIRALTKEVS